MCSTWPEYFSARASCTWVLYNDGRKSILPLGLTCLVLEG